MIRGISLAAAGSLLLAGSATAQRSSPVAARQRISAAPYETMPRTPDTDPGVGAAPFVVFGTLIGAGAVALYWVHVYKANSADSDGMFFIPPVVFVTVGLGGLSGGVMGWKIYGISHGSG